MSSENCHPVDHLGVNWLISFDRTEKSKTFLFAILYRKKPDLVSAYPIHGPIQIFSAPSTFNQHYTSIFFDLFNRLGAYDKKDAQVKLSVNPETTKKKAVVPEFINNPSSFKEIFTYSLDIRSVPKKVYFAPSHYFS